MVVSFFTLRWLFHLVQGGTFMDSIDLSQEFDRYDFGVCSLRGRDFQHILEQEFGQWKCLGSVYNLLHKLGYSYLKPRPRHLQTSTAKQTAFMQALPEIIATIAAQHVDKKIAFTFKTKRVSASKAHSPTCGQSVVRDRRLCDKRLINILGVCCGVSRNRCERRLDCFTPQH
jgi:Winged helix-turn helix